MVRDAAAPRFLTKKERPKAASRRMVAFVD
jgi:hypothetical protein